MLLVWGPHVENYWCQHSTQKSRATPPLHSHLLPTRSWKGSMFTTAPCSKRKRFWNPKNPYPNQGSQISVCFSFSNFYFVLAYIQLATLWQFQVYSKETQPYTYMCPFSPNSLPIRWGSPLQSFLESCTQSWPTLIAKETEKCNLLSGTIFALNRSGVLFIRRGVWLPAVSTTRGICAELIFVLNEG